MNRFNKLFNNLYMIKEEYKQMYVDKYKPQFLENIVGNKQCIESIQKWFESWFFEKNKKRVCALLSGTSGIGKTLCVELFIKKYDLNPILLNPDDKIEKEYIMKTILPSLQISKSFSSKKNIFIIHDIDCYDDYGFISCIVNCLKETKIPVIATCNNRYDQSLKPIIPYCLDVKFQKPAMSDIIAFLIPIIKSEGIIIGETKLKQLVEDYDCDIRSILNNLEFYNNEQTCQQKCQHNHSNANTNIKDKTMSNIFDNTKSFMSQNVEMSDKQTLFWLNNELLPLMIHENYPYNNIKMKNEAAYLDNISESIKNLSDIDLFEKDIHMNGNWELLPYTAWLSIKSVANCHAKTQIKFTSFFEKRASKKQTMNKNIVEPNVINKKETNTKNKKAVATKTPKQPKTPKLVKAAKTPKVVEEPVVVKTSKVVKTLKKKVKLII